MELNWNPIPYVGPMPINWYGLTVSLIAPNLSHWVDRVHTQKGAAAKMNADGIIELALWVWFVLTAFSVIFVAYDLFTRTPEMRVMKWGWLLVTLYAGPVALIIYWLSCREPAPGTHEKFIAPLWKQSVGPPFTVWRVTLLASSWRRR